MPKPKYQRFITKNIRHFLYIGLFLVTILFTIGIATANAQDYVLLQRIEALEKNSQLAGNTIWVLITGSLVFFMNAGFAMLETGFCQNKAFITTLAKNTIVFTITTAVYWILGFGFMFGDGGKFLGTSGFLLFGNFSSLDWATNLPLTAKFFFQLTFAATAATIVSGAVTERIKFGAFVAFSCVFVLIYSVSGHWAWGGGWLYELGFRDFAGSTVVHSVGGCAALTGTLLLKPRTGKYIPWGENEQRSLKNTSFAGNKIKSTPAGNLSLATLGCFILWLGWFGFNAGSTLAANAEAISHILLATLIAGAFGALASTTFSWIFYQKPSLTFIINGILAGCVSITAPCAFVNLPSAAVIGFVGGVIVLYASIFLEKMEIDDPVGAVPVHLFCGVWGTLAVGLFSLPPEYYPWSQQYFGLAKGGLFFYGGIDLLMAQLIGILIVGGFVFIFSWLTWVGVSLFFYRQSNPSIFGFRPDKGLRVSLMEEVTGIDSLFAEGEETEDLL